MNIILETPRLLLGEFTEADAPLIFMLNADPEVVKYIHEPVLEDEAAALDVIRNIILPQYLLKLGRWAVFIKATHQFIGWCGLKYRPELDEIDLGYRLIKSAWGQGFATEAAKACLNYGLNTLQLNKIIGRAHVDNTASIQVLEKIGMQFLKSEEIDDCPVKTYSIKAERP